MKVPFRTIRNFFLADKKQPIRDAKSYKEAIKRVTVWQSLFEEEEARITEYFDYQRSHSKKLI